MSDPSPPAGAGWSGRPARGMRPSLGPPPLGATLLVALSLLFGSQLVRFPLPVLGGYLRATTEVEPTAFAFAPFLLAVAVPVVIRILRPRGALVVCGTLLAAAWSVRHLDVPAWIGLAAAIVGVTAFLWFLALVATRSRAVAVYGVVLGLTADTALRHALGARDLGDVAGTEPTFAALGLAAVFLLLLVGAAGRVDGGRLARLAWLGFPGGHAPRAAVPLVAVGPLLFLHWIVWQRPELLAALTGWPLAVTFTIVMVGNVGALALAAVVLPLEERGARTALAGFVLLAAAGLSARTDGAAAAVVLVALAATGPYLAWIITPPDPSRPAGAPTGVALGVGHVLFAVAALASHLAPDRDLPFGQIEVAIGVGILLALLGIASLDAPTTGSGRDWRPAVIGAALLVAGLLAGVL